MPRRFETVLSRASDEVLQNLVGESLMRLLQLLDPSMSTPQKLKELAVNLHGETDLLMDSTKRNMLIDLLRPDQARMLVQVLGLSLDADPYYILKTMTVRASSKKSKALFNFFEIPHLRSEEVDTTNAAHSVITGGYSLFEHQRIALRRTQEKLGRKPYRSVLHMPTGSGKTRTAMTLIAEHLRSFEPTVVVWLAHSEELCDQAANEFSRAWASLGNRSVSLCRYWGNQSDFEVNTISDGIVVAGLLKTYISTTKRIDFINNLAKKTTLVVIDEAHSAIAETYKLILGALVVQNSQASLLGLTATPGRTYSDIDADQKLADFFGRQKVTLDIVGYDNPIEYLTQEGYLAKVKYRSLFYANKSTLSREDLREVEKALDIPNSVLKHLADDEKRNLKILIEIEGLAKTHSRIIVFATTVEHSNILAAILRARGYEADSVTSQTSQNTRFRSINDFKKEDTNVRILCNFGVLTTGFDVPQTSAALIARPTKSLVLYSQMVGRAIRGSKAGGNKEAEIVTVIDQNLPGFRSVSEAFSNWEDVWE